MVFNKVCFQVEQKYNEKIKKYQKDIFFNGNIISTKTNDDLENIYTGPLDVFIADKWHMQGGKFTVVNFLYESL